MGRNGAIAVMVMIGAVLAGCGDDEEALSTEEFLEQGNAICTEGNERLDAAFEEAFSDLGQGEQPEDEEVVAVLEDTLVPEVQGQLDDIRELEAPDALADDVEQFLDDAEAALDEVEEQLQDDPESFLQLEEDPFLEVNAQAEAIGLTACGDTS